MDGSDRAVPAASGNHRVHLVPHNVMQMAGTGVGLFWSLLPTRKSVSRAMATAMRTARAEKVVLLLQLVQFASPKGYEAKKAFP